MSADTPPAVTVRGPVSISAEEILRLIEDWFEGIARGAPASLQRRYLAPGVKVALWTGSTLDVEEHVALHRSFEDEIHRPLTLDLAPVEGAPGRVLVCSTIDWQATIKDKVDEPRRIRAIADDEWEVERGPDGRPRFARYLTRAVRYLPGSARFEGAGR